MSWLWILLLIGIVANGVRLRRGARALPELGVSDDPVDPQHEFLVAEGVQLDAATRRAASAHARARGLRVVDLVPGDLPVEHALYLLRVAEPQRYAENQLGPGRGAGHAIVVERELLERARLHAGVPDLERVDPARMAQATQQLKTYAGGRADLAVAAGLHALVPSAGRFAFWRNFFGDGVPLVVGVHWLECAALLLGLGLAPLTGVLALVAFQLQPAWIFQGTALRPRDRAASALARIAVTPLAAWLLLRGWLRSRASESTLSRREELRERLAGGTAHFFEARRGDCPFCGGDDLRGLVRAPDRFQHKPGEFSLERCAGCGHVFQNPQLSLEGLDFYYQDFYDGDGEGAMAAAFAAAEREYHARAECLRDLHAPRHWLDVGTGHGHFCVQARQSWPATEFDGLDMSANVDQAARRGWIRRGHRGLFPEIAPKLEGDYDVVSMFHYLEHTRDPLEELAAAALVLQPGGYLVVEVPDPECAYGRLLGSRWVCWFQPQHLHFLPLANLRQALERLGFQVRSEQRGSTHIPADLSFALFSSLAAIAPPLYLPWTPPDPWWRQLWRFAVLGVAAPVIALTLVVDRLLAVGAAHWGWPSNTYRVVAQKPS